MVLAAQNEMKDLNFTPPKRSVAPKKPSSTSSSSLTPKLKYRLRYEHASRDLVVGVIEAKVYSKLT